MKIIIKMELNQELYDKCVAASVLLFSDMLSEVIAEKGFSDEIVNIIKEDNAKRLYNLALKSIWHLDINIEKRIFDHFNPNTDKINIYLSMGFFDTIH